MFRLVDFAVYSDCLFAYRLIALYYAVELVTCSYFGALFTFRVDLLHLVRLWYGYYFAFMIRLFGFPLLGLQLDKR